MIQGSIMCELFAIGCGILYLYLTKVLDKDELHFRITRKEKQFSYMHCINCNSL